MPNWCENTLTITGDKRQLKKFYNQGKKQVKGEDAKELSLENFYPTPVKLLEGEGWYDWRVKNWGTKWDLCDVELLQEDEYVVEYCFNTAWSPCSEAIKKISRQFPKLHFRLKYEEGEAGFLGVAKYHNGKGSDNYLDL